MADHFVIDGSNLATEGRTEPSLAQLRESVAAFRGEHPGTMVTVVVDASFEHRIDPAERVAFSKLEIANEVVSPPAGAVGRGDGFLLQIANRTNATVVSNDSFQEFHAEYDWLFEPGRLIGGKPVPAVGWIFSLRRPVRGIVSRKTTQKAKKDKGPEEKVREAIAEATADVMTTSSSGGRRRRRGGRGSVPAVETAEPEAVNEPAPFLQFVIDHRLGTDVEGEVDAFSSHGAFVVVDGVRCYVPIAAMGEPRPTRARDVLTRGETRTFVVQAVDAPRRGIELALPGFAKVAGAPSEETVQAEVRRSRPKKSTADYVPKKRASKKDTPKKELAKKDAKASEKAEPSLKAAATKKAPSHKARIAKKTVAKKALAAKTVAKKAPAKVTAAKKTPATKNVPAKKTAVNKIVAKKAPAKKPTIKQPTIKKTPVTKTAAKTTRVKKTPVKKAAVKKTVAPKPPVKNAPAKSPVKRGRRS